MCLFVVVYVVGILCVGVFLRMFSCVVCACVRVCAY